MKKLVKVLSQRIMITIIVMLILVAVTIRVVVDSDIIGQAEEAGTLYKNAYEEENVGNVIIDGKEYSSFTEYLQSTCEHKFGINGICIRCKIECTHSYDANGVCTECGMGCTHEFDEDGICTKCGKEDLINFTLFGEEYTAKRGMTFGDWVTSSFNTAGTFEETYADSERCVRGLALVSGSTYSFFGAFDPQYNVEYYVRPEDTIDDSCDYFSMRCVYA